MSYIGLDIGTSTVSSLLVDSTTGRVVKQITVKNDTAVLSPNIWECKQQPERIVEKCCDLIKDLSIEEGVIEGIGFTGQMHGIVYVDQDGMACSDFITWQDERGNQPYPGGGTYCEEILRRTGVTAATGFGLVTVFYDSVNGQIPPKAAKICTIMDYVAMRLSGIKEPVTHISNAASFGFFDLRTGSFDLGKLAALEIPIRLLPKTISEERCIGRTKSGVCVAVPIGDNQASFLGAVGISTNTLVNIGTGSQISVLVKRPLEIPLLECRPFVDGKYLLNGASLCGGSAYAVLEEFFRETIEMIGIKPPENLMQLMDAEAEKAERDLEKLRVDTRFRGTRAEPWRRGSIRNISPVNLTPGNLAYGTMRGICEELFEFYKQIPREISKPEFLVASGNGIRNSRIEQKILENVFALELRIPQNPEEAAFGAVLTAVRACGAKSWKELQEWITYQNYILS